MAYSYYVPLVVQSSQVTGTVTDFVALLNHTFAPWKSVGNGGHIENTAAGFGFPADFDVYDDSGLTTAIPFEIVAWDATTGAITGWIQTDVATSVTVYIAYGDASITTYQGSALATWAGIGFAAVYHMDALPSNTWIDVTSPAETLSNTNGTLITGWIEDAGGFNGTTAYASGTAPVTAAPLTISCWAYPDALASSRVVASLLDSASAWNGYVLVFEDTPYDSINFFAVSNNFASFGNAIQSGAVTTGWQHVAGVEVTDSSRYVYLDGVSGSQETTTVVPTVVPDNITVAATTRHVVGNFFFGGVDELRVHDVARDAAWLEAEYNSQNDATAFWVLGSEVPVGAVTGPAYYGYVGYYQ